MLTPEEISNATFVRAIFGGYDMIVVDDFLKSLKADYTALYEEIARLKRELVDKNEENARLKREINVLLDKAEARRSTPQ